MIAFGWVLLREKEFCAFVEQAERAENALMVLTAGLANEDRVDALDRRMHLHAAHLDVVEARIDGVKKDLIARNEALAGDLELAHESLVKMIEGPTVCKKKLRKMVKK